jgi:hypothetical protein
MVSLKDLLEKGKGQPAPNDVEIDYDNRNSGAAYVIEKAAAGLPDISIPDSRPFPRTARDGASKHRRESRFAPFPIPFP